MDKYFKLKNEIKEKIQSKSPQKIKMGEKMRLSQE